MLAFPSSFPCWGLGGLQAISFPVHISLLVVVGWCWLLLVLASCNWLPDFLIGLVGANGNLSCWSCFSWCSDGSTNCSVFLRRVPVASCC